MSTLHDVEWLEQMQRYGPAQESMNRFFPNDQLFTKAGQPQLQLYNASPVSIRHKEESISAARGFDARQRWSGASLPLVQKLG